MLTACLSCKEREATLCPSTIWKLARLLMVAIRTAFWPEPSGEHTSNKTVCCLLPRANYRWTRDTSVGTQCS